MLRYLIFLSFPGLLGYILLVSSSEQLLWGMLNSGKTGYPNEVHLGFIDNHNFIAIWSKSERSSETKTSILIIGSKHQKLFRSTGALGT